MVDNYPLSARIFIVMKNRLSMDLEPTNQPLFCLGDNDCAGGIFVRGEASNATSFASGNKLVYSPFVR